MVLDPGHFHAVLPFKYSNPRMDQNIHVHATDNPGLDSFIDMIESFNRRKEQPTSWRLHVHRSTDPLCDMIRERQGDIAIIAGKNRRKAANAAALAQSGIHVLADKPMVIHPEGLVPLREALSAPVAVLDMMTCREDGYLRLQRELLADPGILGGLESVYVESTHCLSKTVGGKQLRRPDWYYDIDEQGEGIVDVSTHYIDLLLLMISGNTKATPDVRLVSAIHWPTMVEAKEFRAVTGTDKWPEHFNDRVENGLLELMANGEIIAEFNGIPARVRIEWRQQSMPGISEGVNFVCVGATSTIAVLRQPDGSTELDIIPRQEKEDAVKTAISARGLDFSQSGTGGALRIKLSAEHITSHECQFSTTLNRFLDYVENGVPEWEKNLLNAKYSLLMEAKTAVT